MSARVPFGAGGAGISDAAAALGLCSPGEEGLQGKMGVGKEAVDRPLSSPMSEEVTRKLERTCQVVTFGAQVTSADAGNCERAAEEGRLRVTPE